MSKSEARHQAVSRKAIVGASSPGKSRSTWNLKAELPTKLIQHLGSDLNPSSLLRTQKHARSKSPTHPCRDWRVKSSLLNGQKQLLTTVGSCQETHIQAFGSHREVSRCLRKVHDRGLRSMVRMLRTLTTIHQPPPTLSETN